MNFPRYIRRDARDFFYLTLRTRQEERLKALTGLDWRRPLPQGAQEADTPKGPPPRALEASLNLGGQELTLLRLPTQGLRATLQEDAGPGALAQTEALWAAHVDLGDQGAEPVKLAGAALPARPLAQMAGTRGQVQVFLQSQADLFLVRAPAQSLGALRAWLKERPEMGRPLALALAPGTAPVLRFQDGEGQEALRGGPLQAQGSLLLLRLEAPRARAQTLNTSAVQPSHP